MLTGADRAVIFLRRNVSDGWDGLRPVAAAGVRLAEFARIQAAAPGCESSRVRKVLQSRAVVELPADAIPAVYARTLGVATVACTAIAVASGRFGALFVDRDGAPFELDAEGRRHLALLAKIAGMIASGRSNELPRSNGACLKERLEVAREIHDSVMPALSAVLVGLHEGGELVDEQRNVFVEELMHALANLRSILSRPPGAADADSPSLAQLLDRLTRDADRVRVDADAGWETRMLPGTEPLVEHFLSEAVQNAEKHGQPGVDVRIREDGSTLAIEVSNKCAPPGGASRAPSGLGLRLLSMHALQRGALVGFGPEGEDRWHVRLVLPECGASV